MKKFEQVQQYILTEIKEGRLAASDLVASEKILGQMFDASRATVRRAMDCLVTQGILFRVQGKGTFVSKQTRFKEFNRLKSLTEQAAETGISISNVVISYNEIFPKTSVASIMEISTKQKVAHFYRVRMSEGVPLAFEDSFYLSSVIGPINAEVVGQSIYKYLEEERKVKISYGTQDLDAVAADEKLSIMLNVPKKTPLLRMTFIGHMENDKIFEYTRTYYRCDKYTFSQIAIREK